MKACTALGGSRVGGVLTPLGTIDFSSYLIGAQSANPDVMVFLLGGDDMVNALKQAVQFGLDKKVISPAPNKSWSRWRACRRRRASEPG